MDKRKNNGNKGHSTKAIGVDKRKNKYKDLLEDASTPEEVVEVIKKLKNVATEKGDVQAIKLFLEYYLGKPKESLEIEGKLDSGFNFNEMLALIRGDKQ
jgi:hypothetical protein